MDRLDAALPNGRISADTYLKRGGGLRNALTEDLRPSRTISSMPNARTDQCAR